nr:MAG TPA: hypothetical protein [Caudoviricetes sp.]
MGIGINSLSLILSVVIYYIYREVCLKRIKRRKGCVENDIQI